jgi:MFS family permease
MTLSPDKTVIPPSERSSLRIMIVLILIEVFAVFETSMAITAIPSFMRVFEADASAAGWTTTAYLLVGAASAATGGRLGDMFGRRKVLAVILFGAACGSLVSVLAVDLWMVVLGRGIQGLAAAALPLSFGLVRELLPPRRVPMVVAMLAGIIPICTGAGSLLAGLLLDHSGWRLLFMVATGMGIVAGAIALTLPRTPGLTPRPTVDLAGALLIVPAVGGVLFGAGRAEEWGWTDARVLGSILAGLVALGIWVWWELRAPAPTVDVRQFTDRKVGLTSAVTVVIGIGPMGAGAILTPMVLQLPTASPIGQGLSATTAGVVMLISAVIGYGGALLSGRIAQVAGARWAMALACLSYLAGASLWIFSAHSLVGTAICTSLLAIGSAFAYTSTANLIVEAVPEKQTGEATGMNKVLVNVAVAVGMSITAVFLTFSTVPGTHLPTQTALTAACVFMIGCTLVSLLLTMLIGARRPVVDADVPAPGAGATKAATGNA